MQCNWFTHVRGTNPQTGSEVDEWKCAIAWMPMLSINISQEVHQGAAATESFRNEMLDASEKSLRTQVAIAGLQGVIQPLTLTQDGR